MAIAPEPYNNSPHALFCFRAGAKCPQVAHKALVEVALISSPVSSPTSPLKHRYTSAIYTCAVPQVLFFLDSRRNESASVLTLHTVKCYLPLRLNRSLAIL